MQFEHQPSNPHEQGISSNAVQMALMRAWSNEMEEELKGNELALKWIGSDLAERFRLYVENHPDEIIDPENEEALEKLLEKIKQETLH